MQTQTDTPRDGDTNMTLTFIVTVKAKRSVLCKHLGSRLAVELHEGGPIYLNDLIPELEYESGPIEKVEIEGITIQE